MGVIHSDTSRHLVYVNLSVWENSTSVEGNSSNIGYQVTITQGSCGYATSWAGWAQKIYFTGSIAGQSIGTTYVPTYNYNGNYGPGTVFKSGTLTVPHNTDGTKSIDYSISFVDNANGNNSGVYYTPGNGSASGSMTLTTIAREAQGYVYSPSGNKITGQWGANTTNYYAGTVVYKTYFTNNKSNTTANLINTSSNITSTGTVNLSIASSIQTFLRNNSSYKVDSNGEYHVYCYRITTIGSAVYTTQCTSISFSNTELKSWLKPTFSSTPISSIHTDTASNYLTTSTSQILKSLSSLRITLSKLPTLLYGTTLTSMFITRGRTTVGPYNTVPQNFNVGVEDVVDTSIKLVVFDSRGLSYDYYYTCDSRNYSIPSISNIELYKKVNSDNVYAKANGTIFKNTPVENTIYLGKVYVSGVPYEILSSIDISSNGTWSLPETNIGSISGDGLTGYLQIADNSRNNINSKTVDIQVSAPTLSIDTTNHSIGINCIPSEVNSIQLNGHSLSLLQNNSTSGGSTSANKWWKITEFHAGTWSNNVFSLFITSSVFGSSRGVVAVKCYDRTFGYLTLLNGNINTENVKLIQDATDTAKFTLYYRSENQSYDGINITQLTGNNSLNITIDEVGTSLPSGGTTYNCTYDTEVESGTNSNGSWTKFKDGTMICRNIKQFSITTPKTIGPLFYGYINDIGSFPQPFIEIPNISYTHFDGSDCICLQPYAYSRGFLSKTTAGAVYPITCSSHTDAYSINISYIAIGRWK